MIRHPFQVGIFLIIAGFLFSGCAGGLPRNEHCLEDRSLSIPPDAAPVYSWHAKRDGLRTFWGNQNVNVEVTCWIPDGRADDAAWSVSAENEEGKILPYLGIERQYKNENGALACLLTPPLDLRELPDGLYVTLVPNVVVENGEVKCLKPFAAINEIRAHAFRPFRVTVPLMPDWSDPLTPAPERLPPIPEGTPIPLALD